MPTDVELRTDHRITTLDDDLGTPKDAKSLHDWPEEMPQADEPVTVAVMDSGIHRHLVDEHPWFSNVTVGKRFDAVADSPGSDKVGHGSGCASIIAKGAASTIAQMTGDELPVEFYSVRIFGNKGRTGFDAIKRAYEWMIEHGDEIDIANLSWGARQNDEDINRLHERMIDAGIHDVVAAGNTGDEGGSPATSLEAFSAGAVDASGEPTRFSSVNPYRDNPDVAALGKNVKMARAPGTSMGAPINDQFTKASGTSFAAPWTVAAYVIAMYRKRANWDQTFEEVAPDIPGTEKDGSGLLKLAPALELEEPVPPEEPPDRRALMTIRTWPVIGEFATLEGDMLPDAQYDVEVEEGENDGEWTLHATER